MKRRVRVLALLPFSEEAASVRFRVSQFVPLLADAGFDLDLQPLFDTALFRLLYREGHMFEKAGALLSRMVELAMRAGRLTATELQQMTDESLIVFLAGLDLGDAAATERLRRFVARFRRRALPKRVLVLPYYQNQGVQDELLARYFAPGQPEPRFQWEAAMEAKAKQALGQPMDVILYCPKRRMQLKEAKTLVRFPGSGERTLPLDAFSEQIPRLRDLAESYPRMWKLYVFTSVEDVEDKVVRRRLQELCLAALPSGCRNALVL